MNRKTVAVLGGGIGGVAAAVSLRKRLDKEHRVILVDQEGQHIFWPSLLWLQVGQREPRQFTRDLALLQPKGIEVVKARVQAIDPQRRAVQVDGRTIEADFLVVALGAELGPESVPGMKEAGHVLYTVAGAAAIRDARLRLQEGKIVVLVGGMPFKCPPAPYEAAMLLAHDFRRRGLRDQVSISIHTPEPGPMPIAGPAVSGRLRQLIEGKGIAYFPEHQVTAVDPARKSMRFANGAEASCDLLIVIPPHRAPQAVQEAGLAPAGGWVPVDKHTMATKFPGIYAIGDVTGIPLPVGKPLPKAGVFASRQAQAVAQTIAAAIAGRGRPGRFTGRGECFIEIGGGKAGLGRGEFYAEPAPVVRLHPPGRLWHLAKVLYERRWLAKWF